MKLITFILMIACSASAQFTKTIPFKVVSTPGIKGTPGVFNISTNSATSGTSMSVTNTSAGEGYGLQKLHIACADDYGLTISNFTNNLGVAGTLYTNFNWYDSTAHAKIYYWVNSPMTWAKVQFSGTIGEASICMLQVTNAALASIFSGTVTNFNPNAAPTGFTNTITSDTTSLVLGYSVFADGGRTPTFTANKTVQSYKSVAAGTHCSTVWTYVGAATVSCGVTWDQNGTYGQGSIMLSIKGYP